MAQTSSDTLYGTGFELTPSALSPDSRLAPGAGLIVDVSDPESRLSVDLRDRPGLLDPEEGLLGASVSARIGKRVLDLVVGTIAVILLAPVFVAAAVLIRIGSPGPILYVQDRVGKDGKVFSFLKFRTMKVGADAQRDELADVNECEGPIFKIRHDPRITPAGRLLRKLSVDELPQLLHVLRGQMSLVGPRPPLPDEVATYGPWERQRLLVKPGITCIWQVSGRSDLDFDTWVSLDVDYIRNWCLRTDIEILAKTIPAVISGRGAY